LRWREFIAGLGSAVALPLAVRARQGDRMRRIGVLLPGDGNDPFWKARISAFTQALSHLGWTDGHNVRMDLRFYGDGINLIRALAQELVGLQAQSLPPAKVYSVVSVCAETPRFRSAEPIQSH
jgi:putative tryptophan/tyrosine transport system substrate-binding protein